MTSSETKHNSFKLLLFIASTVQKQTQSLQIIAKYYYNSSETDANSFAQWDPEDLPKCSRIQCPATKAAPHSTLKPINHKLESRDCSQVLVAECDEGYQVKRSTKSIFCQSSGQWTGEVGFGTSYSRYACIPNMVI